MPKLISRQIAKKSILTLRKPFLLKSCLENPLDWPATISPRDTSQNPRLSWSKYKNVIYLKLSYVRDTNT